MLEYTLDDAETLLTKNLQTATKNLNQLEIDLDFLRDQLTTTEVSILLCGVVNFFYCIQNNYISYFH